MKDNYETKKQSANALIRSNNREAEEKLKRNYQIQNVISTVLRISLEPISLEKQLERILDLILSIPWLSLQSKGCIFLVEDEPDVLVMRAQRGLADVLLTSCANVPFGKCLCGRAASTGKTIFADHIDDRHETRYEGILPHGHYNVPIKSGERILGVINMYVSEGHKIDPVEKEFLSSVANTLAGIVERKQAEDKLKRNYYIQSTISSVLQISLEPVSLEEQLKRILDLILSIPFLSLQSKGCIFLVEDEPDVLLMRAQRGLADALLTSCANVPFGKCLCGRAASTGKTIFADHIDDRHETGYEGIRPHGHYNVPIKSGDRVLGVICMYVKEEHKRDKGEEEFLSTVANTLAGIIERKRAELEKEKLQEKLAQSEKLSALGRITANVAHEIRNPLTSLGGFARRLNNKIPDGSSVKEYAEVIISEANRLEKILRNVLTYSMHARSHMEKYNINEIIDESLKVFEVMWKDNSIRVERNINDLPQIQINRDQVREAIDNLLSNAIDSMADGGTLTIASKKEFFNEISYIAVKITDEGEGIPEEHLSKIFEPFFSTKALGESHRTGLGLSICRKIMEEHGGLIKAESTLGEGSTFSLYFPLS